MKPLWWIEKKDGTLAPLGRAWDFLDQMIVEGGGPTLFYSKSAAQRVCCDGERPVKVRLVRDKEKVML